MISISDARIEFINARTQEIWKKVGNVKQYKEQGKKILKMEAALKVASPENKELVSNINEEYSLLIAYIADMFYAAGLLDGMKFPELMAGACREVMLLQVVNE